MRLEANSVYIESTGNIDINRFTLASTDSSKDTVIQSNNGGVKFTDNVII